MISPRLILCIALAVSLCLGVESYSNMDSTSASGATPMQLRSQYEQQKRDGLPHPSFVDGARPPISERHLAAFGKNESYSAALRTDLLENYDRNSFPWETVWARNTDASLLGGRRTGMPVEVGINFHKVHEIDITAATADLVVWFRMNWTDPRLAWDPAEYGNMTYAWFWVEGGIGGNEASEIWVPDMYLWNQEEPIGSTLDSTYVVVSSTGSVFWSRPGRIKATCRFKGLDKFPFDDLKCVMEVGSWAHSGLYMRPVKYGGTGFSVGGSETAGQSFAEFNLTDVSCEEFVYPPFPNDPESDFPVLLYMVTFERASEHYVRGYVLVQVLLNLCGFCCFWIRPHVGERMGLAITALLAAVASELTVTAKLPAASEVTWFVVFAMISTFFSVVVVFQSTVVVYFFHYTGSDLFPIYTPTWILRRWRKSPRQKKRVFQTGEDPTLKAERSIHDSASSRDVELEGDLKETSVQFENGGQEKHNRITLSEPQLMKLMETGKRMSRYDAGDFRTEDENKNNVYWQKVSNRIDEYSRLIVPSLFFVFLAIAIPIAQSG